MWFYWWVVIVAYIFWIWVLYQITGFANMFSCSMYLGHIICRTKDFSLDVVKFILCSCYLYFWNINRNHCLRSWRFTPVFFSKNFIVLPLKFRSVILYLTLNSVFPPISGLWFNEVFLKFSFQIQETLNLVLFLHIVFSYILSITYAAVYLWILFAPVILII